VYSRDECFAVLQFSVLHESIVSDVHVVWIISAHCVEWYSAIVEGKDNANNKALQEVTDSTRDILRKSRMNAEEGEGVTQQRKVQFWGGGDMVYIAQMTGTAGGFARDGECCPWCEVAKSDLSKLPSEDFSITLRTLERQYHLAHCPAPDCARSPDTAAFPFECPGCEKSFSCMEVRNQICNFSKVTLLQEVENDHSAHANDNDEKIRRYMKAHKSVLNARPPLIDIEIIRHVGCCLHLNMSVIGTLWEYGICSQLSGDGAKARVEKINERLGQLSVHRFDLNVISGI
jgi:hypothetical protein